jgi:hypothetical protein
MHESGQKYPGYLFGKPGTVWQAKENIKIDCKDVW